MEEDGIKTRRTHSLSSYSSVLAVYDLPIVSHTGENRSVYACYHLQTPSTRFNQQASPPVGVFATEKADRQKTRTGWQSHTAGGLTVDRSHGHSSAPVRDDLLLVRECLGHEAGRPRRLSRKVLGRSGAEWREAPMRDRTVGG